MSLTLIGISLLCLCAVFYLDTTLNDMSDNPMSDWFTLDLMYKTKTLILVMAIFFAGLAVLSTAI